MTILSDVLIETSLVELGLFAIALHIRLNHGFLHVLSIERRVSQFRNYFNEFGIAMFVDLGAEKLLARVCKS